MQESPSAESPAPDSAPDVGRAAPAAGERWTPRLAFGVAWGALAAALLCVPFLPTHDGAQHVFAAWYESHVDAPWAYFEPYVVPNPDRITSMGFDAWFRPLEPLVGWATATQLALLLIASLWVGGWWVLARHASGRRLHPLALGVAITGLPWMLYMGFFNFLAGLAWTGWALTATCRIVDTEGRARIAWVAGLSALMALVALFHSFAACVIGLCVAVGALSEAFARRSITLPLWFAPTALPVAAWVFLTLAGVTELQVDVVSHPALTRLSMAGATILPGIAAAGWTGIAALLPGLTLIVAGLVAGLVPLRSRVRPAFKAWGLLGAAFLLLHTLAPFDLESWQVFAPRWGLPGLALAWIACSAALAEQRASAPSWAWALGVAIVIFFVGRLALDHRALWQECGAPYRAAELEPNGEPIAIVPIAGCAEGRAHRFPLVRFASNSDVIAALEHRRFPDVYVNDRATKAFLSTDATIANVSDNAALHYGALRERGDVFGAPGDQDRAWLELNAYLASEVATRDAMFVLGPPAFTAEVAARGFSVEPLAEDLALLRFTGCRARVPDGPSAQSMRGAVAFFPSERRFPVAFESAGDALFARVPCGPIELELWVDDDADGVVGATERACREASGAALLRRMIPPDAAVDVGCAW